MASLQSSMPRQLVWLNHYIVGELPFVSVGVAVVVNRYRRREIGKLSNAEIAARKASADVGKRIEARE